VRIIIVSGFLGSGKTTFLSQALTYFYQKGVTCSLIVNEVGEVGVDNRYFSQSGYPVKEILGGCLCCSSASEFQRAIEELRERHDPACVLIEPSGIANPIQIQETLARTKKKGDALLTIAILDSERIDLVLEAVYPMTVDTAKSADKILISKTDVASSEEIEKAISFAEAANPGAALFRVNLTPPLAPSLLEEIFRCRKI
jgi:G3E family GTPase